MLSSQRFYLNANWFQNIFIVSSILPKNEQKIWLFYYDTSSWDVFFHCLRELKTLKRHFQINSITELRQFYTLVCLRCSTLHSQGFQWSLRWKEIFFVLIYQNKGCKLLLQEENYWKSETWSFLNYQRAF